MSAYFSSIAVNAALHRLIAAPLEGVHNYEHLVASVGITLANNVFKEKYDDHEWVYTSEQKQEDRIPDYSIEAVYSPESVLTIIPWLHMEFKRPFDGKRTYEALHQVVHSVIPTMSPEKPAVYLVVIAGFFISFWELDFEVHHGRNPKGIRNLWGCRSLMQSSHYKGDDDFPAVPGQIPGIRPIYLDDSEGAPPRNERWLAAKKYGVNALLDLREHDHGSVIEELMKHISRRRPAAFIDPEMDSDDDPQDMEEGGSLLDQEDMEEGSLLDQEDMEEGGSFLDLEDMVEGVSLLSIEE